MPFTASHPAAILPLLGTGLPASALVIGSMSPDLPYYFPVATSWPTHTAIGIVTIDLLLGATAWLVWHGLLAAPAMAQAPAPVRRRLAGQVAPGLRHRLAPQQIALTGLALTAGALTHVLWDEFSHPGRWGARHLHQLATSWGGLPGYRWVQYASGVVGAAVEIWWLWRWWQRSPLTIVEQRPGSVRTWLALASAAVAGGAFGAATSHSVREAAFRGATRGGGAAVGLALVLAVGWQLSRRRGQLS